MSTESKRFAGRFETVNINVPAEIAGALVMIMGVTKAMTLLEVGDKIGLRSRSGAAAPAREAVVAKRGPGRPPGKARRKPPIQLCPSPGCKNRAAPVFGMLCGKHKGAPKGTVRKWREARRAAAKKR